MAITDWPAGTYFLSPMPLTEVSAARLARELLNTFGSLNGIFSASRAALTSVNGMGDSKYVQVQAIFEMAQRALREQMSQRDALTSPQQVRDYLCLKLGGLAREVFVVLYLDAQNRVVGQEELFAGTLTQTSVYPREVVKRALHHNAAALIFAHNHPSGVAEPSRADEKLTASLKQALSISAS